ncbi:glyoxalase domain-containing protein 5-like isoform X1 [Argonauta hians]
MYRNTSSKLLQLAMNSIRPYLLPWRTMSTGFKIDRLDHFVITVKDMEQTVSFYTKVLGMDLISFKGGSRKALKFGNQKINLHEHGREFEPKASEPMPGSADVCFITQTRIPDVVYHLKACNVPVVEGPVERTGAEGPILSVYVRDPDDNLVEISNYLQAGQ